jgi:hypothetical protein
MHNIRVQRQGSKFSQRESLDIALFNNSLLDSLIFI